MGLTGFHLCVLLMARDCWRKKNFLKKYLIFYLRSKENINKVFFIGVIVIKLGILKSLLGFAKTNEQH